MRAPEHPGHLESMNGHNSNAGTAIVATFNASATLALSAHAWSFALTFFAGFQRGHFSNIVISHHRQYVIRQFATLHGRLALALMFWCPEFRRKCPSAKVFLLSTECMCASLESCRRVALHSPLAVCVERSIHVCAAIDASGGTTPLPRRHRFPAEDLRRRADLRRHATYDDDEQHNSTTHNKGVRTTTTHSHNMYSRAPIAEAIGRFVCAHDPVIDDGGLWGCPRGVAGAAKGASMTGHHAQHGVEG